jgi:multidrug transporter EmrE-like cation transporter
MLHHRFAIWSGILGASASCLAKLALDDSNLLLQKTYQVCSKHIVTQDLDVLVDRQVKWLCGELLVRFGIVLLPYWKQTQQAIQDTAFRLNVFEVDWCQTSSWIIPRGACLLVMILCNVYMVASFVRGMQCSGSVAGTALSTASNFATSALLGYLLFGELHPTKWWFGFACVAGGVLLLSSTSSDEGGNAKGKYRKKDLQVSTDPTKQRMLKQYGQESITATSATSKSGIFAAGIKSNKKSTAIVDRTFANQCPLCDSQLFDESTGESPVSIADLSPHCFHIAHAKCLKESTSSPSSVSGIPGKTGCPVCDRPIRMFISAKQAAHFAGFWLDRVESILKEVGPVIDKSNKTVPQQPLPASVVREKLQQDASLTAEQKKYIHDDPTGLGKGLGACLEWGGYVDYNTCAKGAVGWSQSLRSKGLWKYDAKKDDLWLWEWGDVHPRQRCEGCQFVKRPLPTKCRGCKGSSECAQYCSDSCAKRDWQRHKMNCNLWMKHGPDGSSTK